MSIDPELDSEGEKGGKISRRAFVKGAIGVAALGATGATAAAILNPFSVQKGGSSVVVPFIGAKKVSGPAPQGIPQLNLKINDAGEVEGVPTDGKTNFLDWAKYCGHDAAPGLQESYNLGDNALEYFLTEEKVVSIPDSGFEFWYKSKLGSRVLAADFDGPVSENGVGKGAAVKWRSKNQSGNNIITAIIVKVDLAKLAFEPASIKTGFLAGTPELPDKSGNLMAFVSFCKHFCCVPGYHESKTAATQGFADKLFCTCHFSVYDPVTIKAYDLVRIQEEAK
jgi:Rieske Fe-S protein